MSSNPANFSPPNRPPMADRVRADFAPILSKYGTRYSTQITALRDVIAADPLADQSITPTPPIVVGPTYVPQVPDLMRWLQANQGPGKSFDLQPGAQYIGYCGSVLVFPGMTLRTNGATIRGCADLNPDLKARSSSLFALAATAANFLLDATGGGTITADPSFVGLRAIFVRARGFVAQGLTLDLLTTGIQFAPTAGNAKVLGLTTTPNLIGDGIYIGGGDTYLIDGAVIPGSRTQHCIRTDADVAGQRPIHVTVQNCRLANVGNETFACRQGDDVLFANNQSAGWVRFGQADTAHPQIVYSQGVRVLQNTWLGIRSPQLAFYTGVRDGHAINNNLPVDAMVSPIHVQDQSEVEVSGNAKVPIAPGLILKPLIHAFGSPVLAGDQATDVLR